MNDRTPRPAIITPALPASICYAKGQFQLAGRGRMAGSHQYLSLATGESIDCFVLRAVREEANHVLAVAVGNDALSASRVRANHEYLRTPGGGRLAFGEVFLGGPLSFGGEGEVPQVRAVWRLDAAPPARPVPARAPGPARSAGRIRARTAANWACVEVDGQGSELPFHLDELPAGMPCRPGLRVTFAIRPSARGPIAADLRPVAAA